MVRVIKNICKGILLVLLLASPSFASLENQVLLESHLENQVQKALNGLYGEGNFIVQISVSLTSPRYEVKYTQQSQPKLNEENKDENRVNILPGYPVIKNLGPSNLNELPFDSVTSYIESRIRRINVNLLVNRSFPRGQVGRAQNTVKEMLNLRDGRDKINVSFRPFMTELSAYNKPAPSLLEQLSKIPNFLFVVALVLFVIFVVIYILLQLRAISASREIGDNSSNVSVNPNIELPANESGGGPGGVGIAGDVPKIKRYFDFIDDQNVDDLIFLLKKENVSIENVSVIVSFLNPRIGSKVLSSLDIKNQATLTSNILGQRLINRDYLEKLETKVRDWMECFVGGQTTFQRLFKYVSGEVKKQLMTILGKSNPQAYKQFRQNVVLFDDLKLLSDDEIKDVISEANIELLSTSLVSVDEDTYQKIDFNLTTSAKDMIKQFLDLKGQTLSKKDVEAAQEYILNIVEKLETEGKIDLRSKIKS